MFDLFGNNQQPQSSLDFPIALTERYRPHNPGRRNRSRRRRPIQWVRWIGLAISLAGLAAACYSCR